MPKLCALVGPGDVCVNDWIFLRGYILISTFQGDQRYCVSKMLSQFLSENYVRNCQKMYENLKSS